jgi:hypothetical protein
MQTRREHRPADLKCQDCGHEFVASVPHVGHMIDELSQPFRWTILPDLQEAKSRTWSRGLSGGGPG